MYITYVHSLHASAPVVQPSSAILDVTNLDRFVGAPIQIPNNLTFDYQISINVTIYQLTRIYSFITTFERKPGDVTLDLPVLLPVLNDYTDDNPFYLTRQEINRLFAFVYKIINESRVAAQAGFSVPPPNFGAQSANVPPPSIPQSGGGGILMYPCHKPQLPRLLHLDSNLQVEP